ncbi:AEC family transporter [Butyrivibrio sp. VCB2006]|uniref:AEC family transporter n=1 Tax=Butyrivibrio sp. VCB2006 TaxID=1280679 RepID=UPI0004072824|nr:AEC family transporter [Butyrivibrio sp. VCB2006]
MENLIFSLNATLPIFMLMVLGYIFNKLHIIDEKAATWMNKFVFKIALPVLLFEDLAEQDFAGTWNGKFVLFCFAATFLSIVIITLISKPFIKNKAERGEFIQGSYRSSAALLGIAFIHNIYGEGSTGMAPLMIIGSVPLYNIFAVTILMLTAPKSVVIGRYTSEDNNSEDVKKELIKKTALGIITNPILIGIFCGLIWSLLKLPMPKVLGHMVSDIGGLSTPLGLMSMGATFDFKKALGKIKPTLAASFIKLFALVGIFMPIAVLLGFRNEQIIALLVMLGSATTVSSFVMSKNMGHDGTLSSSIIMMTTFGCSFSLTFWLFVLKSLSVI